MSDSDTRVADPAEIAYFSMEIEIDPEIPTYSGGLGVLAGDTLRAAADLAVPMVAVTLVHRKGYFRQKLDPTGHQSESDDEWSPEKDLERLDKTVKLTIEGRDVQVRAWKYTIRGLNGFSVPVILLDTRLPENSPWDQTLTDHLYGEDERYRLCQEAVLGLGGYRMLVALGLDGNRVFHMNEGHSALLTLAVLQSQLGTDNRPNDDEINQVRKRCVFTTHTPVPAGHDQFSMDLVNQVLGEKYTSLLHTTNALHDGMLNMTYLALRFAHYVNGVGMHHGEISRSMFPGYPVRAITNGVHAGTWTSPPFQELYDRHVPEWRRDNLYLRYAVGINAVEIGDAHVRAKRALLDVLRERAGQSLSETVLTIGFARRATQYKRFDLLFSDLQLLQSIAHRVGPIQIVYGGKAHPKDEGGKAAIRAVFKAAEALRGSIPVVYIENYDARWAQFLTSGVDLWLNTPHRPFEASGTSGMKAALNGVPSLSILDGWWIEGCIEGVTGWAIGSEQLPVEDAADEIASLYTKLEQIVRMYYERPQAYFKIMCSAIALNGSFFNTQRMLRQYVANAYVAQ